MGILNQSTQPDVIAHRGASHDRPENTAAAFDRALAEQAQGLEVDVQLSKDAIPVIFHDRTLKKFGLPRRRIADLTYEELQQLDAGAWFDEKYKNQRLLSLEDLLHKYGRATHLLLEIKVRPADVAKKRHHVLVEKTVELLVREKLGSRVFILSFDEEALALARRLAPRSRCVLNLKKPPRMTALRRQQLAPLFAVSCNIDNLTSSFAETCHEMNKPMMVYTCNEEGQVRKALRAGIDVIMSDRPSWLHGVLDEKGKAN